MVSRIMKLLVLICPECAQLLLYGYDNCAMYLRM